LVTFPACEGDKGDNPGEDESDGKGPDGEKGGLLSTQLHLLQSGLEKTRVKKKTSPVWFF
jgi:hypothetical protein